MEISDNALIVLTGAQLREFADYLLDGKNEPQEPQPDGRRWVYGIQGIRDLFGGISHVTAQKWKESWLAPAVIQRGRKIMTDADKALALFDEQYPGGRQKGGTA